MTRTQPLVSVVVCTKNGMPYLSEALASLAAQRYRHFEVVAQDAASTDGTIELLADGAGLERVSLVSEPDEGIGDAFNRAFARCAGAVVTSLDADNVLEPDALERAVTTLSAHPGAAALYGSVTFVDERGAVRGRFVPDDFSLGPVMRCELVPPFSTAFFVREVCGDELCCDPSMATCADFDLWLRLSHHRIVRTDGVLGRTRLSAASMTLDPERYETFCRDKLAALDRHLRRRPELAGERDVAVAGVYCWAAESLIALEGASRRSRAMVQRAAAAAPSYWRIEPLRERIAAVDAGSES